MSKSANPPRDLGRIGVSLVLIAAILLAFAQLGFLAYATVVDVSHDLLLLESAVFSVLLVGLIALVAYQERRSEKAEEIAERQLSHLADFATDLYWETDLEGIVITAGGRLMPDLFPDINRVLGRHYLDVINLDENEMNKMRRALKEADPYSDILSVFRDPDGARYYVSLSATPRYDRSGNVVGYLGVGTNVTRRIETQGRLKHMAEHDMLTGLANRYKFQSRIERDLTKSDEDEHVAL